MCNYKTIFFVSDVKDPSKDASSTQIMMRNILSGFKQLGYQVCFLAIVDKNCSRDNCKKYYSNVTDEIIFLNRITSTYGGATKKMFSMLKSLFVMISDVDVFNKNNFEDCCVITHSPAIDSILYAKVIKKFHPGVRIIQYWSDPITLSLKTIDEYRLKRCLFRYIENKVLSHGDVIVYGTKSLYDTQRIFFKRHSHKMGYCDVCFTTKDSTKILHNKNEVFGYLGNYYSTIRNIIPLYKAFSKFSNGRLIICGSGDVKLMPRNNIAVHQRIPQNEILRLEEEIDIEICILNKVGFQVPGKIFYETDTNKKILVILDGPQKDDIFDYLNQFKRFVFCENNEMSILKCLNDLSNGVYDEIDKSELYRLTPQYICQSIINGGNNDK